MSTPQLERRLRIKQLEAEAAAFDAADDLSGNGAVSHALIRDQAAVLEELLARAAERARR